MINHGRARINTETRIYILGSVYFSDIQWLNYNHGKIYFSGSSGKKNDNEQKFGLKFVYIKKK